MDLNLLEKTTFWVEDIDLAGADLGRIAAAAAGALGLRDEEVMVVDVRPGLVAFDLLRPQVPAESIAGKEKELLHRLAREAAVTLGPRAAVHSEGVLGMIALDSGDVETVLRDAEAMAAAVGRNVARRVLVFASGSEVREGRIRDTNSPFLAEALGRAGFRVDLGGILEDDPGAAERALEDALGRGYGLVVTTGGVGAEKKDVNVEAILKLDPRAHTPWILHFTPDGHRHHKAGVRIAVGRVGPTRLVALPGPHEEVRVACERLLEGMARGATDGELAGSVAGALRERWHSRMKGGAGDRHPGAIRDAADR